LRHKGPLRIVVLGGGPAGLYFTQLWKMRYPETIIELYEQNPADATWGFGVVFSDRALEFLRLEDPETADFIAPHMETWHDMTLVLKGEQIVVDGVGFSAIGRLKLLQLLHQRVRAVGIEPTFGRRLDSIESLGTFDLLIGADGLHSVVRQAFDNGFETSLSYDSNKFIWYGTTKRFETLCQTFVETDFGTFNAHHYRFAPDLSTFLIECDAQTWDRGGFATKTVEETRAVCEHVFAHTLGGHRLISNNSSWRSFPWLRNDRWHLRNMVLVGDAAHTAHFSIGSGTRLAMEDALALVNALAAEDDIARGLARYEMHRRPIVAALVNASKLSAAWYEQFHVHMKLRPLDFAYSYITRADRIDDVRLRAMSPRFMARFEAERSSSR
jgi:2-polyprenyl-6-methoxyphenol hydroxylase-like FAD-dependent oxidoreductase